jgi:hypothetical protein
MSEVLERRFAAMGARLSLPDRPWCGAPRIDVRRDGEGELFEIAFAEGGSEVKVEVVDVRPRERHLLLLVRDGAEKSKFLCGHDERHWFVAAIPESARGVSGVTTAKIALQPQPVQALIERLRPKDQFRRRNEAYVRQGEWFFVPANLRPEPTRAQVRANEPLTRGRGKAHVMQWAFRRGGRVVYANRRHPTGISEARYLRLTPEQRKSGGWTRFVEDPEVYAKGSVRHPDHATIHLARWHRVFLNTEQGARAMRHVAFLD